MTTTAETLAIFERRGFTLTRDYGTGLYEFHGRAGCLLQIKLAPVPPGPHEPTRVERAIAAIRQEYENAQRDRDD